MSKGMGVARWGLALVLSVSVFVPSATAKSGAGGGGGEGGPNVSICYKGIAGPSMVGKLTLIETGQSSYDLHFEGSCKNTRYFHYGVAGQTLPAGANFDDIVKTCRGNVDCTGKVPIQGTIFEADFALVDLGNADPTTYTLYDIGCIPHGAPEKFTVLRLFVESALTFSKITNDGSPRMIESDVVLLYMIPYENNPDPTQCNY